MRGLTLIVAEASPERFRASLTLAAAQAALGTRARLFLQADAVALLRPPLVAPEDARHVAAGLPSLAALLEEAFGLGVEVIACQSGLALAGMRADRLDPRIKVGGLVSLLQMLGDDRLTLG